MNFLRVRISIAASALFLVFGSVVVLAQQRATTIPKAYEKGAEMARFPMNRRDFSLTYIAAMTVGVDPQLQLDAQTQLLYQQMATTLDGYANVPDSRVTYYGAVNNQGNYSIAGWGAFVEGVQSDGNGGYNVNLSVTPSVIDSTYGLNTIIFDLNYSESYNINNGVINYLNSADPGGQSGQLPIIVQM